VNFQIDPEQISATNFEIAPDVDDGFKGSLVLEREVKMAELRIACAGFLAWRRMGRQIWAANGLDFSLRCSLGHKTKTNKGRGLGWWISRCRCHWCWRWLEPLQLVVSINKETYRCSHEGDVVQAHLVLPLPPGNEGHTSQALPLHKLPVGELFKHLTRSDHERLKS